MAQFSPLSLAVRSQRVDIAEMLLDHGALPMDHDGSGHQPYVRALYRHIECENVVRALEQVAARPWRRLRRRLRRRRWRRLPPLMPRMRAWLRLAPNTNPSTN